MFGISYSCRSIISLDQHLSTGSNLLFSSLSAADNIHLTDYFPAIIIVTTRLNIISDIIPSELILLLLVDSRGIYNAPNCCNVQNHAVLLVGYGTYTPYYTALFRTLVSDISVLYCTALYCTLLYCTALYCTVLYCAILHCTILYCTALHYTLLHYTVLYCAELYCTALYCTALHCTALHYTILYCTVLYCTILHCTALCCNILHCTILHCTILHCTALHCTALHCTVRA